MYLPTRMPGRWSMRFLSSGIYDMPVSVCWDGERLSFSEGGKPHNIRAATVNACTEWFYHGPESKISTPCLGMDVSVAS